MTNFIEIEGHRIAYTVTGTSSNPPIFFVHGIMSFGGLWASTIDKLKDRYFCVSYDQLGFGDSDKPVNADYSIAQQAKRTLMVADHFGIDKFIVGGHSMGGQIAAYLTAVIAPQRVLKLVFVDGVVTGQLTETQRELEPMVMRADKFPVIYKLMSPLRDWKPAAYWTFGSWFYKIKEVPFNAWERHRYHTSRSDIAHSAARAWNEIKAADLRSYLGNIACSTLIAFGKQDDVVPVEQAYEFKERYPSAQLVIFDECGHFPMLENFNPYIAAIENFLKE